MLSLLLKSWFVFSRFGLKDPPIFEQMKLDNHRPWRNMALYGDTYQWNYHRVYTRPIQHTLSEEDAVREWDCLLDFWFDMCFVNNTYFEVILTADMGVGIVISSPCSFNDICEALLGLLEPVSYTKFDYLHALGYPSLYEFVDDEEDQTFSVLFGPLALCNSSFQSQFAFEHFHINGFDLLACFTYDYGEVVEEFGADADILEISTVFHTLELTITSYDAATNAHVALHTNNYIRSGQLTMANGQMKKWFHRCRASSILYGTDMFEIRLHPGEEFFIYYRY